MKKYLLVSLTILFAAAFVWAEEAAPATPSVDVEADATLSWGIDLGEGDINAKNITHGFKNEASFSVKFPLINKGNKVSAKTDAPVYGQVSLKNIELKFLSEKGDNAFRLAGQVEDIEAKLFFYGAYLTVYDAPSFRTNYAQIWKPLRSDKKYKIGNYRIRPGFTGMGTKLGYTNKNFMDLDVGIKLGSNGPWDPSDNDEDTGYWKYFDGKTALGKDVYLNGTFHTKEFYPPEGNYFVTEKASNEKDPHSRYVAGVDFSIKPLDKMLELALAVNSTLSKDYKEPSDGALNFGAEVKSEPIDSLKLKAGFDGGINFTTSKFMWDTIVTAEYKWVSGGVYLYSAAMPSAFAKEQKKPVPHYVYDAYFLRGVDKNGKDASDMAFFLQFATLADKKASSNLIEGLEAGVHLASYNILTFVNQPNLGTKKMQFPLLLKLWGSYRMNLTDSSWLEPFASIFAETNHGLITVADDKKSFSASDPSFAVAYYLGVTYSPIEKVEVTAQWNHGSLQKNKYRSVIGTPAGFAKAGYHNGEFVLSLKLEY